MRKKTISILIKQACLDFDKKANQLLQPYGLTSTQFKILKLLYQNDDLMVTQKQIEEYFNMTNPTVTGILQNLEKHGFITRQTNPQDSRSKVIGLETKSLNMKMELLAMGQEIDNYLTQNLSNKEKEELAYLLIKMQEK